MNRRGDEFGEIIDVVSDMIRYLKTYPGEVLDNQDELNRGRCKISIPMLGWISQTEAPWVEPEYIGEGALTPKVGATVSVYFIAGDSNRPVYRSKIGEFAGSVPKSYKNPDTRIIYDDGVVVIMYDSSREAVSITGAKVIELNGDDKPLVIYAPLDAGLQEFITKYNTDMGVIKAAAAAAISASGLWATPLDAIGGASLDISGSESQTVVSGG